MVILQPLLWALVVFFASGVAFGQDETTPGESERRFTLDIASKKIQQSDFRASTSAHLRSADGRLNVEAGAAVEAREITLTLKQVRVEVVLRASAGRLREVFERYQQERRNP